MKMAVESGMRAGASHLSRASGASLEKCQSMFVARNTVTEAYTNLFESGKGTDCSFRVHPPSTPDLDGEGGSEIVHAHSSLLSRYPVFETMLEPGRWAETTDAVAAAASSSSSSSSSSGSGSGGGGGKLTITIKDVEPAVFKELLRFVYSGSCSNDGLSAMADHLLAAASRWRIEDLIEIAALELVDSLDADNLCDRFFLARTYDNETLRSACMDAMSDMLSDSDTAGYAYLDEGQQRSCVCHDGKICPQAVAASAHRPSGSCSTKMLFRSEGFKRLEKQQMIELMQEFSDHRHREEFGATDIIRTMSTGTESDDQVPITIPPAAVADAGGGTNAAGANAAGVSESSANAAGANAAGVDANATIDYSVSYAYSTWAPTGGPPAAVE